jgi:hypothetical protein
MRVLNTFRAWDVRVDEFVMVGSTAKVEALKHIRPHLFVDDRGEHVAGAALTVPSAQVLSITVEETEQVELFEEAAIAKAASTRPSRRRSRSTKKSLMVTTLLSTLTPTSEAPIEGNQVEVDAALRDRVLPPDAAAPVDPAASARRRSAQR